MLLRQMQFFLSAAACKSFGKAAKLCYVSQPAFSLQIKQLEKELGVKLIDRNNCKFQLTPAGQKFYEPCKRIVGEAEALLKDMQAFSQEVLPPQYTIGCRRNYNLHRIIDTINKLNDKHENYYLRMVYGDYADLWSKMQSGEIDMLIADERNDDYSGLDSLLIESSNLVACVPQYYKFNHEGPIDISELRGFNCVIIADKEFQEREKEYYRQLLNFQGGFDIAKDIADSVTYIVDASVNSFLPRPIKCSAPNFYNKFTKILPLLKNKQPIEINYKLFWPKENKNIADIAHKFFEQLKTE